MYKQILIFIFCCFVSMELSAQKNAEKNFSNYTGIKRSKELGIIWKKSRGFRFEVVQSPSAYTNETNWKQGKDVFLGSIYDMTAESRDGNCLILYPNMYWIEPEPISYQIYKRLPWIEKPILARDAMTRDLNDGLKLKSPSDSLTSLNIDKYVVTLANEEALFNADTVFVAQIPLHKPYRDKYEYCTGIYVWKEGRRSMVFRCFFTEEGKRKEQKFLHKFYKMVKYRDGDEWNYDEKEALKGFYLDKVLKVINEHPIKIDKREPIRR